MCAYIICWCYRVNFFFTTIGCSRIIYIITAAFIIWRQSVRSTRTTHLLFKDVNCTSAYEFLIIVFIIDYTLKIPLNIIYI